MTDDTNHPAKRPRIERQRRLPFSKAVEISAKSIRVRFWRSMLTVSSIVLAIAFLMWQLTSAEVVRTLEDLAAQALVTGPDGKPIHPLDLAALSLKDWRDTREAEQKKAEAEIKPIVAAFDTADARLAAGEAMARVPVLEGLLKEAEVARDKAREALYRDELQKVRADFESLDERIRLLKRQISAAPGDPRNAAREAERRDLERRKENLGREYERYQTVRTRYDTALRAETDARLRLEAGLKARDEALARFPDARPAPEGSDEYRRLFREREASRRLKEGAEARVAALSAAAERAKNRYEAATYKALKQRLAKHGEQSATAGATGAAARAAPATVRLPFNVRLSPSRLWIIVLALLVCLVGITNAMLMSVTERYREIGTMKCLGALDSFIVKIFLLESSFMGAIGVVLGIVLGFVLAVAVQWVNFGSFVFRYFPAGGIVKLAAVAFVAGAVLSILGGILPAQRAARMAPVEAMRIEE